MPTLHTLPYDLLLNIAVFLDLYDIHALHLTCKSLYFSFTTRPVYRKLANDLLRRCRPLPLKGFQRLIDLSTEQFIHSVNKAYQYEHAWRSRTPQPLTFQFDGEDDSIIYNKNLSTWRPHACNNYLDLPDPHPEATSSADTVTSGIKAAEDGDTGIASTTNLLHTTPSTGSWYRIIHTPPGEDIHWLSPITSSYVLCATKLGKVVCWDIQRDSCLAEWNPGFEWELWKCRVDFDTKTVYFTMATVLHNSYDDKRITEFSLIRLRFSEDAHGHKTGAPDFLPVAKFKTTGVVMNIFILDPNLRLLSTFVWRATTNTIGLFVLLDWDTDDYVYVDTGIDCVMSSNWSCILFDDNVVIHCEDCEAAFQHFYPLAMLREHTQQFKYAEDPKKPDSDKPTSGLVKMRRKLAASIGGSKNTSPSTSTSEVNSTSTSASLSASTSGSASTSNSTSSNPTPDADANPNSDPSNPSSDPSSQAFILKSLKEKTLPKISSYPLLPYESLVKRFTFPKPPPPTRQYTLMPVTQALLDLLPGNISNVVVDDYNDDEEGFLTTPMPMMNDMVSVSSSSPTMSQSQSQSQGSQSGSQDYTHTPPVSSSPPQSSSQSQPPVSSSSAPGSYRSDDATSNSNTNNPNPFPFPPWYPESAHFVRQWWPTLPGFGGPGPSSSSSFAQSQLYHDRPSNSTSASASRSTTASSSASSLNASSSTTPTPVGRGGTHSRGSTSSLYPYTNSNPYLNSNPSPAYLPPHYIPSVPRVSCTVVLLASHDPITHSTQFVLSQHYFCVPMTGARWVGLREADLKGKSKGKKSKGDYRKQNGGENEGEGGIGLGSGIRTSQNSSSSLGSADGSAAEPGQGQNVSNVNGTRTAAPSVNGVNGDLDDDMGVGPGVGSGNGDGHTTNNAAGQTHANGNGAAGAGAGHGAQANANGNANTNANTNTNGRRSRKQPIMQLYYRDSPPEGSIVARSPAYSHQFSGNGTSRRMGMGMGIGDMAWEGGDYVNYGGNGSGNGWTSTHPGQFDQPENELLNMWYLSDPFEVVCVQDESAEDIEGGVVNGRPRPLIAVDFGHAVWIEYVNDVNGNPNPNATLDDEGNEDGGEDEGATSRGRGDAGAQINEDGEEDDEEREEDVGDEVPEEVSQAIAAALNDIMAEENAGAVTTEAGQEASEDGQEGIEDLLEFVSSGTTSDEEEDGDEDVELMLDEQANLLVDNNQADDPKCLRFVTFPSYDGYGSVLLDRGEAGIVRTLEIPPELDLDKVETINLDQSQGAIILSVKDGKIFVLCYE